MTTERHPEAAASERPPASLESVDSSLKAIEGVLLDAVASDFPFVSVLAQHLIRAGGKRLRAAITFLSAGFGPHASTRSADVLKLASAIELTHLATLHHDDVIDEADTRRSVLSVNAKWTNTLAVLSGDYLFARSSELAAQVGGEVPEKLAATIAALCEGQVREIEWLNRLDRTPSDCLRVAELKTARLVSAAAYLGARVGGCDLATARALETYGTAFGMAFQTVDDLLDFLGDDSKTGKSAGTDLRAGVYTLPLIHAIEQRGEIADLVRENGDLSRVVAVLHETGSFNHARAVAERYAAEAVQALSALPPTRERDELASLVEQFVVKRIPVSPAA